MPQLHANDDQFVVARGGRGAGVIARGGEGGDGFGGGVSAAGVSETGSAPSFDAKSSQWFEGFMKNASLVLSWQ
jgi:hypothetical protein